MHPPPPTILLIRGHSGSSPSFAYIMNPLASSLSFPLYPSGGHPLPPSSPTLISPHCAPRNFTRSSELSRAPRGSQCDKSQTLAPASLSTSRLTAHLHHLPGDLRTSCPASCPSLSSWNAAAHPPYPPPPDHPSDLSLRAAPSGKPFLTYRQDLTPTLYMSFSIARYQFVVV